jgi:hypothetical protein
VSKSNVHKGGMNIDRMLAQLTDREVDDLLDGRNPVQGHETDALIAAIETLRSTRDGAQPQVGADLEAVFSQGLAAGVPAPPEWAIPPGPEPSVRPTSWRTRLRTRTVRALTVPGVSLGTLAGKLMIVAAVAVAGIGGFYAAGVVGVARLPDLPLEIDAVRDQHDNHPPEDAGNAGPEAADGTGNIEDSDRTIDRGPAVNGGGLSEPATTSEPARSSEPPGQRGAGSGDNAQADANAPGQSSEANESKKDKKVEKRAEKKAKRAEKKAKRAEKKAKRAEKKAKRAEKKAKNAKAKKGKAKGGKAKGGKRNAPKERQ